MGLIKAVEREWKKIEEEFSDKVLGAHKVAKNAENGVEALFNRIEALEAEVAKLGGGVKAKVEKVEADIVAPINAATDSSEKK